MKLSFKRARLFKADGPDSVCPIAESGEEIENVLETSVFSSGPDEETIMTVKVRVTSQVSEE